ncbi:uncharacterized protein G2W53_019734 [Senna tora]|uniref:Uncharacterized protein n=1 Tax=Senna tora TaxID=362788 RepID=A0A834TTZ5_9FABA|nr:uncharacterized protein G2W53_019734 [Senna tora]
MEIMKGGWRVSEIRKQRGVVLSKGHISKPNKYEYEDEFGFSLVHPSGAHPLQTI